MHFEQYQPPYYSGNYYGYGNYREVSTQFTRASAEIIGGPLAPNLRGNVTFTEVPGGTEVSVEVNGLPPYKHETASNPPIGPHGFHLHERGSCFIDNPKSPFAAAGQHYNPTNQPHGNHAGDFPVLFSNDGYSKMTFFTNKFTVQDVIGKTVIIHESPDNYRVEPVGATGRRLACGIIQGVS